MDYKTIIRPRYFDEERSVYQALSDFIGRDNAVSRTRLVNLVSASIHRHIDERKVRDIIKSLRRQGHLIGSAAGDDGGYYMIATQDEFDEFMAREYGGKVADMLQTMNAMRDQAAKEFQSQPNLQPALF